MNFFSSIAKSFFRFLRRKFIHFVNFLNLHYTPVVIAVLMIFGLITIVTLEYVFRYDKYDFWLWKQRAIKKSILYFISLILLKLILLEI